MTPSRLAFVQEFEQQLSSYPLRQWFDTARTREAELQAFRDPDSLRRFLHSPERVNSQKPEIWRALVTSVQLDRTPEAVVFVLGLLEPALGHLTDNFDEVELDPDDLWQETVACALRALANPKLLKRRAPLVGLVKDTLKHLCFQLRNEFAHAQKQAPLLDLSYEPNLEDGVDGEILLAQWCRRAGVTVKDRALIFATRTRGIPLGELVPAQSRSYYRLWKRRHRAEVRLSLLVRPETDAGPPDANSMSKIDPKNRLFKG